MTMARLDHIDTSPIPNLPCVVGDMGKVGVRVRVGLDIDL